jgi:divalent metal cation (Fe/Co/Zn/Cd) transporter
VMGKAAPAPERERMRGIITKHDEIVEVLDLRTMYMGPGNLVVAARVDLRDDVDAGTIERVSDEIELELRRQTDAVELFLDATPRRSAISGAAGRPRPAPR